MSLKFDWANEIDRRLQEHSLSIITEEDVMVKNAVIFNSVLSGVHKKWPTTPFYYLILSLHEYYTIKFMIKILDRNNKEIVIRELKKANPFGVHRKSQSYNRNELSEAYSGIYGDANSIEELFGVDKINKEEHIASDGISGPSSGDNPGAQNNGDEDEHF